MSETWGRLANYKADGIDGLRRLDNSRLGQFLNLSPVLSHL
jgi:hypothetical protein